MKAVTSNGHGLGYVKDEHDDRDKDGCLLLGLAAKRPGIPKSVDLRTSGFMPEVYDQGSLGCHDEATEVLTEDGWTPWGHYGGNSMLATVDPVTRKMEMQMPTALHSYEYDGQMYYIDHQSLDFSLTPNHRMWVRKWSERDRTLREDFQFVEMQDVGWYSGLLASPVGWNGVGLKKIEVGNIVYSGEDFVALVALILSDGWVGGTDANKNTVSFCCFREDRIKMVKTLAARLGLHELPGRPGVWKWNDANLAAWVRQHCYVSDELRSHNKRVPQIIKELSQRQIKSFLSFYGDQHVGDNRQFYTSSVRMADDLQELLLRTGSRSGLHSRDPRSTTMHDGRRIEAENCHDAITITEWRTDNLSIQRKNQVEVESYSGGVFCATVPNGLLVTRRRGKVLVSGNSCTANSVGANLEFSANKNGKGTGTPSRLFIYYKERELEGDVSQDSGAQIRDGFKVVANIGAPPETEWPYDISKFAVAPPSQAEKDAADQKALTYYRVKDRGGILDALAAGYCVSFGFTVYESFERDLPGGVAPMPEPGEQVEGGHAVLAVGYDLDKKLMLVRNSWGDWNGEMHGYFWMPFGFWDSGLCSDFWCCEVAS